jgi:GntR family trehalose operon transcriptional repressor
LDAKYLNIYNEIISKIENNEFGANTKLPSENEMIREYNVSRDTIRKALNLLEQNGYIQKLQGKGSFILDINKLNFPVSGLTSFKELTKKMNVKCRTYLKELEKIPADSYLKTQLDLSDNEEVWKVIRLREIDGKKIILDKDFFNTKYVPSLSKKICEDSIYDYLENQVGLKISFAKKEITVQQASAEDKKYLDFENCNMIVVVKNYIYLEDLNLFQYTESRHMPDKFKFESFARRK